ncbi:MAG: hypothetical protein JXN61_15455, partial [Sedimentisphaerales bacterium]|nr:hypothetical protein [Sedimentisphaerales bacterium]
LSADQMEIAWRAGGARNGQMPVTMAVARTGHLKAFVENVRAISPTQIMLNSEGVIKAWRTFFGGDEAIALVVSAFENSSQLCLTENGVLINAVVLDMGTKEFSSVDFHSEAAERFVRDMKGILEMFGYGGSAELPIYVLSDGSEAVSTMVAALESIGLDAKAVKPDVTRIKQSGQLDAEMIYDYRLPIGLGLVGLEARGDELNIFNRLYDPFKKEEAASGFSLIKRSFAVAVAALVLGVFVWYAVDIAKPGAIDKAVKSVLSETDMKEIMNRQGLRRAIAAQRPDILELIQLVNDIARGEDNSPRGGSADPGSRSAGPGGGNAGPGGGNDGSSGPRGGTDDPRAGIGGPRAGNESPGGRSDGPRERSDGPRGGSGGPRGGNEGGSRSGIKLQELDFKTGQVATVSGESPGTEQVYKFEKDLNANKYIKDAKIRSQSQDAKTKKYQFSIEFKYKSFGDKKTRK